ncbi:MAG: hypothetical protein VKK04_12835 [Synechococcales bacterium]|nr:hypothetical protein [Synechococcales bacterium]
MKLQKHILESKKVLLTEVEGSALTKAPTVDKVVAALGLSVEAATVLVLTIPAGLPIAMGAAALPLLINIAAAWFHSTYYEIPDAYAALLPRYEAHLVGETIRALEALEICRHQAGVQYIAMVHRPKEIRSVGQAKGLAQVKFSQERIVDLEEQGIYAIKQCQKAYQEKLKSLPDRCPEPQVEIRGLRAKEAAQAEETWKKAWIEAEIVKLQAEQEGELEGIQAAYGRAIASWRQKEAQGLQEYRAYTPPDDDYPAVA